MNSVLITGSSRIGFELVTKLAEHVTPPNITITACRNPGAAQVRLGVERQTLKD